MGNAEYMGTLLKMRVLVVISCMFALVSARPQAHTHPANHGPAHAYPAHHAPAHVSPNHLRLAAHVSPLAPNQAAHAFPAHVSSLFPNLAAHVSPLAPTQAAHAFPAHVSPNFPRQAAHPLPPGLDPACADKYPFCF